MIELFTGHNRNRGGGSLEKACLAGKGGGRNVIMVTAYMETGMTEIALHADRTRTVTTSPLIVRQTPYGQEHFTRKPWLRHAGGTEGRYGSGSREDI